MKKETLSTEPENHVSLLGGQAVHPHLLVRDIMQVMEAIAPAELAEPWDRIGLQIGDPASPVDGVLIALDLTPDVLLEARNHQANMIICHHPAVFAPILALRRDDPLQNLLIDTIQAQISVFAAHTNLDAAPGGVADAWARHLVQALSIDVAAEDRPADPRAEATVSDPRAAASVADPRASGKAALARITPYGRLIVLSQDRSLRAILSTVADSLPGSACRINTHLDGAASRSVRRVAAFPGSFPLEVLADLTEAHVDTVICGECKYHDGLALALAGISAISVGHDRSEQPVLAQLAARLAGMLPQIPFAVSSRMDYNKQAN